MVRPARQTPCAHPSARRRRRQTFRVVTGGAPLHWAAQVERNALKRAAVRRHASARDHFRWYARPAQSSPMSHALDEGDSVERR